MTEYWQAILFIVALGSIFGACGGWISALVVVRLLRKTLVVQIIEDPDK